MATRKSADKFPLWLHPRGLWCKKIRGKVYYFGKDRDAALKEYVRVRESLEAGRPRPAKDADPLTVAELVNAFLTAKRLRVDSGELKWRSWDGYHSACERVVDCFGRGRLVADLTPTDFGKLRAAAAKSLGPAALCVFVTQVKTAFAYAYRAELVAVPVRFGDQFDKPPRRVMRLERHLKAARMIPAADLWKLLDHAETQLRAQLLLGINAAYTQADCAGLLRESLTRRPGWLEAPRNKSGIQRRCPLWPETLEALAAVERERPEPLDPADGGLVFLTATGRRWVRYHAQEADADGKDRRGLYLDAIALRFRKLVKRTGVKVPGGPAVLRHTFRTVADEVKDQPATMLVMGHADHSISNYYREMISDERLQAVTDHVRTWLLAGRPNG